VAFTGRRSATEHEPRNRSVIVFASRCCCCATLRDASVQSTPPLTSPGLSCAARHSVSDRPSRWLAQRSLMRPTPKNRPPGSSVSKRTCPRDQDAPLAGDKAFRAEVAVAMRSANYACACVHSPCVSTTLILSRIRPYSAHPKRWALAVGEAHDSSRLVLYVRRSYKCAIIR
jgi:hypothetical protein